MSPRAHFLDNAAGFVFRVPNLRLTLPSSRKCCLTPREELGWGYVKKWQVLALRSEKCNLAEVPLPRKSPFPSRGGGSNLEGCGALGACLMLCEHGFWGSYNTASLFRNAGGFAYAGRCTPAPADGTWPPPAPYYMHPYVRICTHCPAITTPVAANSPTHIFELTPYCGVFHTIYSRPVSSANFSLLLFL